MKVKFYEEQKFLQWWLWLLIIFVLVAPLIIGIGEIKDNPNVFDAISTPAIIGTASLTTFVITLFLILKLTTEITEKGLKMRFFPFVTKQVDWRDVETANVVNYGFVGGWGIRFFTKYGTVYNVRGNKGLAIILKNGKKFVVGTQKETELKAVLEKLEL